MPSQSATTTMHHVLSSSLVCSIHSGLEVDSNSHQSLEKDSSAVASKTFFLKNKILSAYFDWAVLCGQTSALDYVVEKMRTDGGVKHSIGPSFYVGDGEEGISEDFDKSLFLFLSFFGEGLFASPLVNHR